MVWKSLKEMPINLLSAYIYNVGLLVIYFLDILKLNSLWFAFVFNVRSQCQTIISQHTSSPHTLESFLHCGNVLMKSFAMLIADITKICWEKSRREWNKRICSNIHQMQCVNYLFNQLNIICWSVIAEKVNVLQRLPLNFIQEFVKATVIHQFFYLWTSKYAFSLS